MITETLIFEPDEGSLAVLEGPNQTIQLSFRHNNVLIGKYLKREQAEAVIHYLNEALAVFPKSAASKESSPSPRASQARGSVKSGN
jgi:hypothetical protein